MTWDKTFCLQCSSGKYSAQFGSIACDDCCPGQYQPASGKTNCLPCPNGFYSPFSAATTCIACDSCYDGDPNTIDLCDAIDGTCYSITESNDIVRIQDILRLKPRYTEPIKPEKGMIYFDGNTNKLRVFDGGNWQDLN